MGGGKGLERRTDPGGVAGFVLRIEATEQLPGTIIDKMHDREIPARVPDDELTQVPLAVRDLEALRSDHDGAVAYALRAALGAGEGGAQGGAVG